MIETKINPVSQTPVVEQALNVSGSTNSLDPSLVTKPEVVPTPEVKVEEKKDSLTPRFAELSKREKLLTTRERDIKQREDQLKGTIDFTKSPKKALEEKKLSLEQFITNYLAEDSGKPQTEGTLDPKVAEVLEKVTNWEKKQQEVEEQAKAAQAESNLKAYKANLDTQLKAKPEYKFINALISDSPETEELTGTALVYSIMNAKYQKTGEEMPLEDAAGIAEKFLGAVLGRLQPKTEEKTIIKSSPTITSSMAPTGVKEELPYLPREESIKRLAEQWKQMNAQNK